MSVHNVVHAPVTCRYCQHTWEAEIEAVFGLGNLHEYRIGDEAKWVPRKEPQNGGRPPGGSLDADGYVECPSCGRDFFVIVHIAGDRIRSVEVNLAKPGLGD